jgi:hypothetical protein
VAVSRLADQSKVLGQRLALLEERVRRQEARERGDSPAGRAGVDAAPAEDDVLESAARR